MTTDLTVDAERVAAYLDRLGLDAPATPDIESLRALHRTHLHTVPFENLDIHLGRAISLDPGQLVDKLTRRRRGGFCYELNGAFAALLSTLGFEVTLMEARVYGGDDVGIRFDHLCLRVDVDQPYLVDVGFGGAFLEPLRLVPGPEQYDHGERFVILQDEEGRLRLVQGNLRRYRFELTPRQLDEFAEACVHHQTSRDSHFTWNTICSLAVPEGRVTVRGTSLIETSGDDRHVSELALDDLGAVYRERFGIELTSAELRTLTEPRSDSVRTS